MPRRTAQIEVDASAAHIWTLLASPASAQQERGLRVEFDPPPPIKTGTIARNIDAESDDVVGTITYLRVEPERELAIESRENSGTHRQSRTTLEPLGPSRTRVRAELYYTIPGPLGWLIAALVGGATKRDLMADLEHLKAEAES